MSRRALSAKGYLVANLEMPWSGKREYDVGVSGAEEEPGSAAGCGRFNPHPLAAILRMRPNLRA